MREYFRHLPRQLVLPALGMMGLTLLMSTEAHSHKAQDPSLRDVMQRKLDHAHNLLDALAVEDFDSIADSTLQLARLTDDANWLGRPDSQFTANLQRFSWSLETLRTAAQDRDINAAALGYVDMTLRCVGCHQSLRGVRNAQN